MLRAAILSGQPNRLKNAVELLADLMVPEPDDGDAFPGQKIFPYLITLSPERITMAGTPPQRGEDDWLMGIQMSTR